MLRECNIWSNFPKVSAVFFLEWKLQLLVILSGPKSRSVFLLACGSIHGRPCIGQCGLCPTGNGLLHPGTYYLCAPVWCLGNSKLLTAANWFLQRRVSIPCCDSSWVNTLKSLLGLPGSGQVRQDLNRLRTKPGAERSLSQALLLGKTAPFFFRSLKLSFIIVLGRIILAK
jgi:hypothetical protein